MTDILNMRTKGKFPISIGTSLALECLFGVCDDKPLKPNEIPPFRQYDCVMFNVRTIVRNLTNSVPTQEQGLLTKPDVFNAVLAEINLIKEIILEHSKGNILPSFYLHKYTGMKRMFRQFTPRSGFTPKQQHLMGFEEYAVDILSSGKHTPPGIKFEITDLMIKQGKSRNLMLTHYPVDMLTTTFKRVDLLESHTGTIKTPYDLNTKLKSKPENIPFNRITIQIYGDTAGMFQPAPTAIRKELSELVAKKYINALMSEEKFIKNVKSHGSNDLKSLVLSLK